MEFDPADVWKYQLVIQFSLTGADTDDRFEKLLDLEQQVDRATADRSIAELDGNDVGAGEFNIFLFTDRPQEAFEYLRPIVEKVVPSSEYKVAHRDLKGEEFHILWPENLKHFDVA
ncbi:MAG: transporter related protein [Candidatus Eremiobacteraeota bacterium]|nr:transporter related protein [Candidatus Eremiobacteraeota bacterium]